MKLHRTRRVLWAASAAFAALAGLVVYLALFVPLDQPQSAMPPNNRNSPSDHGTPPEPTLASFEPHLKLDLRRPLHDPPPAPPPVAPQVAKPVLTVKLAGTIVEPGHSKAMLVTADGRTELKGVGQKSGDAEILSIEEKKITVRFHGEVVELKVASEGRG